MVVDPPAIAAVLSDEPERDDVIAAITGEPLPSKGEDFSQTDITPA